MSLPSFLYPLTPLVPLVPKSSTAFSASVPTGGAGPGTSQSPLLSMQAQQETNWCWAATTSSVSRKFDSSSSWSQCNVASTTLSGSCCTNASPCNKQWSLDAPLRVTGNLQEPPSAGADAFPDVQAQLDLGNPVCCHITWNQGGGHFMAIVGYDDTNGDVYLDDPLYGASTVPYTSFVSSYRGSGDWDYTYHTQG
jgi:hypothetical protein